ncbi:MAG TPA: GGDEF domain-containing protein [Devosia sp.]|nr:GGDEF domain-containing protein [Devosia sp.]
MQLDSFTLLVAGCAVITLLGAMFVYFWFRDRTTTALLWWGIPLMFGGAALAFYAKPDWDADFWSISLGNAARLVAIASFWEGLRVFHERKPVVWPEVVVVFGWIGLCLDPGFADNMALRIVVVSLINAAFCSFAAVELWRGRDERLPSRIPLMATFLSFAAIMVVRVLFANATPFPFGALPVDALWVGGFMLTAFAHASFAAFLFISLVRERREATQRSFALLDPLTGLMNRRAFADYAQRLLRRLGGQQRLALLVLDLDHFKSINDRYGHEAGDKLLVSFAETATASVRPTDLLFRMGGEEFCFMLPDITTPGAVEVAERIRRSFEVALVPSPKGSAGTTVSVGIAVTDRAIDLDVLQAAADAALYEAKARGRNRVVVAEPSAMLRPAPASTAPRRLRA